MDLSGSRMNYGPWLSDRRKILSKAIGLNLEIKRLQMFIESDTTTVTFDQYYCSVRYRDWGPKELQNLAKSYGRRWF